MNIHLIWLLTFLFKPATLNIRITCIHVLHNISCRKKTHHIRVYIIFFSFSEIHTPIFIFKKKKKKKWKLAFFIIYFFNKLKNSVFLPVYIFFPKQRSVWIATFQRWKRSHEQRCTKPDNRTLCLLHVSYSKKAGKSYSKYLTVCSS